ncbi:phage-related baseplate assembly protein [Halogeometricum pallidum JCM 14848]|uniref:Phage-related baseplate assembly protein n=1 Tax=Halogeometricum pallidum JCM 14848 TaxID=1227487 RepID=M0DAQ8_HALPD|nr:phage baseplate assembly protein V [Halogeometricum pallidum]ELZ32516.1 phage-related baseplate assembly protein [Halogeometricum pallidum JCM 14848]
MSSRERFGDDDREERTGIRGVWAAVVTDNVDPEKLGRVKVTYPWRDAEDESYWARLAVPMAGSERGTYFLPEVDDEVLVAFENGDIHYPYVLGALWNGKDKPPEDNASESNDVRLVRSRSGHELVFDDTDGKSRLELTTAGGHTLVLDDSDGASSITLATNGGHTVALDDTPGSEAVTVTDKTGANSVVLDAVTSTVEVSAGGTLRLSAPMMELSGDGNVTVRAGGVLTLKGGMVMIN